MPCTPTTRRTTKHRQAQPLNYDTNSDGHLSFYYEDNDDWRVITPTDDGVLHIYWSAESIGAANATGAQIQLLNDGGGSIGNWSVAVGGSSTPTSSQIDLECRGNGTYYVRCFSNGPCGVSYQIKYNMSAPVYGADNEPNNSTVQATGIDLEAGAQEGRLSFYYEDNTDYYSFSLATTTTVTVNTLAETAGASGTMQVRLFNSGGGLLSNVSVPIGGGNAAAAGIASLGVQPAGTYFISVFSNGPCGVSLSPVVQRC